MSGLRIVMLDEDVRLDARALAAPIAKAIGATNLEARMLLRRARGIVAERLEAAKAEALVKALAEAGVAAKSVDLDDLPRLTQPARVSYLARGGDRLVARGGDGKEAGAVAFSGLHAVHGGVVGTEMYAKKLGAMRLDALPDLQKVGDEEARALVKENVILMIQGASSADEKTKEPILDEVDRRYVNRLHVYLDLAGDDGTWWRLRMDTCVYQFREGAPKLGSAMGFRYLIEALKQLVPAERVSPTVTPLLEAGSLRAVTYMDIEEYNRFSLWWLYRRRLGAPPGTADEIRIEEVPWDDSSSGSAGPAAPPTGSGS